MADYATDAAPGMIKREAGMAALTATGYVGTTWDQRAPVTTRATCVINLENPKVSANDESYTFTILGYNAADRSDATILGQAIAGACAGLEGMEFFAVLFRSDGVAFAQQQLPRIVDQVHRQGIAHLQQVHRNRNVFHIHSATTTGTRAASAHINS